MPGINDKLSLWGTNTVQPLDCSGKVALYRLDLIIKSLIFCQIWVSLCGVGGMDCGSLPTRRRRLCVTGLLLLLSVGEAARLG